MEDNAPAPQSLNGKPELGPQQNQKKGKHAKRKPLQHSDEIVFSRGTAIQTIPSLTKQLKDDTGCAVGIQYVWEYRSPSKSVPPHYQCKLCSVVQLQHEMLDHIKGWKHCLRYVKKAHPDKISFDEEEVLKDYTLKKTLRDIAAEVEKMEGRGQLKVILKEPCDVHAFKGLRSAIPRPGLPPTGMGKGTHFGAKSGGYRMDTLVRYPTVRGFSDYRMDQRLFQKDMGHNPVRQDEFGPIGGRDGYGPSRLPMDYTNEYRDSQMNTSLDQPCMTGGGPNSGGDLSNTLLGYLDTFKIENESDAQLVLKVTQKLTDVLMDYRLRNISGGSSMLTDFPSTPPTMLSSNEYSGYSGPPRYSNEPANYYE